MTSVFSIHDSADRWPRVSTPDPRVARAPVIGRSAWEKFGRPLNREVVWSGEWPTLRRALDYAARNRGVFGRGSE